MGILNHNNLKGYHLALDNALINKPKTIIEKLERRGYKVIYLSPYSPFLNTIEDFWVKIRIIIRSPVTDRDSLINRVEEDGKSITAEDCQGWSRHYKSFFKDV